MLQYIAMKIKELTKKRILSVPSPTCGATEHLCELPTGTRHTESHRDRRFSAADAVEMTLRERPRSGRIFDLIMGRL